MVENAERFGLAQLHQLRGRVGRGEHQSYCIFMQGNAVEETAKRLEILGKSNDGFYIAEEDLKLPFGRSVWDPSERPDGVPYRGYLQRCGYFENCQ